MTFDREPDLDNANVGIRKTPVFSRKLPESGDFRFYFVRKDVNILVKVNGTEMDIAGKTLAEYLSTTNYDMKRIAVERNGDIVPKAQYGETVLQDGDSIEIVSFVGGG